MSTIESDTSGSVWKVLVEIGQEIEAGDTLVILESMKMEIPFEAEDAGVVTDIHVVEGSLVGDGDALVSLSAK